MTQLICAAHYFGDCGMGNFWSTFSQADLDGDFAEIGNDGFSHIILIVPWAQFQPQVGENGLDPYLVERLKTVLHAAERARLRVILRLGYLWEISPVRYRTFNRLQDYPVSAVPQRAWERYFSGIYEVVKDFSSFDSAFVSWEDWYWPILRRVSNAPAATRRKYAMDCGFVAFLQMRHDLPALTKRFGLAAQSWDDVMIPTRDEPFIEEYLYFFDTVLCDRLFLSASARFADLDFEYRIDDEWIQSPGGRRLYLWSRSRVGAVRPIVYYHPHIGMLGGRRENDASYALNQLRNVVGLFGHQARIKRVFIDQFNFVTRNPEYEFSSIKSDELMAFLRGAEDILLDGTSGYGVWGYRDWINDKIYNGRFEMGLDGWEPSGSVVLAETADGRSVSELRAQAGLRQPLHHDGLTEAKILLEGEAAGPTEIAIFCDDIECAQLSLTGKFSRVMELKAAAKASASLEVRTGTLRLERVALFSNVLTSGLYTRDRSPRPAVAAIRDMNRRLGSVDSRDSRRV
jgi:hypothetical protein